MNQFRAIQGKIPTNTEFMNWTPDKWIPYLNFLLHFVEKSGKTDIYKVTKEKMMEMEVNLENPDNPMSEHIYRMNLWASDTPPRTYFYKLNAYARLGLSFLKKHPGHISSEMAEILNKSDRMKWAIGQFKMGTTESGIDIVERDDIFVDGFQKTRKEMPSIQVKMMNSLIKIADVYETLADSITSSELKKMDLKDRLSALTKLSFIFNYSNRKMNTNHFTQININSNSVKDVEKAMLDYSKQK